MATVESLLSNAWLATPVALAAAVRLWWHYRSGALRHSQLRTKRLYTLVSKPSWRSSHPLLLQLAVLDALKVALPDHVTRFALERHNSWRMLRDCKDAIGLANLQFDGNVFEDTRKRFRFSYRRTSRWLHVLVTGSYGVFFLVAPYLPEFVSILIFAAGLGVVPFAFWLALQCEAADRLINRMDELYPALEYTQADTSKLPIQRSKISSIPSGRRSNARRSEKDGLASE